MNYDEKLRFIESMEIREEDNLGKENYFALLAKYKEHRGDDKKTCHCLTELGNMGYYNMKYNIKLCVEEKSDLQKIIHRMLSE